MLGANWAIPDAEVNFKVMDTQWGNIVCGRSRSRIAGMSREGYPELPLGKRGRWAETFSVQEALHRARLRVYPANHPILIGSLDAYGAMQVPQRSRVQRRNSRLDHKAR